MEIRVILFQEIGLGISLNNQPDSWKTRHLLCQKGESQSEIVLLEASPVSILQKLTH